MERKTSVNSAFPAVKSVYMLLVYLRSRASGESSGKASVRVDIERKEKD